MNAVLSFIEDVIAMLATPEGQKVVADLEAIAGLTPPGGQPAPVSQAAAAGTPVSTQGYVPPPPAGQPATGPVAPGRKVNSPTR